MSGACGRRSSDLPTGMALSSHKVSSAPECPLTILAVLVAVLPVSRKPGVEKPADTVHADIERAEQAEQARQHHEARMYYERAIAGAKDPRSVHFAHREFGETLATWGESEPARGPLE